MVPAFPCARSVVLSCAPVGQDDTSNVRCVQGAGLGLQRWWKGTPGFSKGESWIPAGTRGTLGSRSCRRVPLESDVNFQLKQSNRGFSFSASHLIWILASPPGIAGFRAGRPAARDPAEVVTSVLLGTHEHTRKTNCMEKSLLSLNCMTVHDLCRLMQTKPCTLKRTCIHTLFKFCTGSCVTC